MESVAKWNKSAVRGVTTILFISNARAARKLTVAQNANLYGKNDMLTER